MARNHIKCPHMDNVVQHYLSELCKMKQGHPCSECDARGPNLWMCLHKNCLHTGCSEQANDHSTEHFKSNKQHCIHMNLSSQRIWCYLCEAEVFLPQYQHNIKPRRSSVTSNCSGTSYTNMIDGNDPSRFFERMYDYRYGNGNNSIGCNIGGGESPESSFDEDDGDRRHVEGLIGLQNIANTCYMNAALQALSNSPPLCSYFLQCGDIIEATSELSGNQRKPGLAKSYHRLVKTMWCKNRRSNGYVVPRDILARIRNVHPMFRGFQQHDTQEFLRCFMDQLHEELKEATPPPPDYIYKTGGANCNNSEQMTIDNDDDEQSPCSSPSPSQSEAEYETCDSGVSERSSLSDELQGSSINTANKHNNDHTASISPSPTHSPSPNLCQRNSITSSTKSVPYSNCSSTVSTNGSIGSGGSNVNAGGTQSQNQQQREKSPPKRPHRSIISDVFDGKLLSSVQCLTCNRISTREETFQDLSLPIPGKDHLAVLHQSPSMVLNMSPPQSGITCTDVVYQAGQDGWLWWIWNWLKSWFWGPAVSLHDCMAAFFSADELKGDNMYSCEKCHKLRNGIKYSRVLELPEMLCVHLKRFRHDLSYSSKISSPVHFPLTGLDMRPYLHKDCKSEVSTYDLTAVICHHGTVGGGHYTSFAKHELTGKWFEFDDQLVTEVTPEIVQNCQAYVLFYRKSNPKMAIIRSQAKELAESNPFQTSDLKFYVSRQWINRFNNFAEPGPIDNYTILCPHGDLPPSKAPLSSQLVVPIQQPLWEFLYKHFGGGPICNRLFECDICRNAAELLSRRQEAELDAFTRLKSEFQNETTPTTIYAISMAWFRQWQLFAEGRTNEEPGPINNAPIAITTTTTTSTSTTLPDSGLTMTTACVRPGSDYAQLNKKLWKFFHNIYGGGPEIILRAGPLDEDDEHENEEYDTLNQGHKDKDIELMDINQDHDETLVAVTSENGTEQTDYLIHQGNAYDLLTDYHRSASASNLRQHHQQQQQLQNIQNQQIKSDKKVSFEDDVYQRICQKFNMILEQEGIKPEELQGNNLTQNYNHHKNIPETSTISTSTLTTNVAVPNQTTTDKLSSIIQTTSFMTNPSLHNNTDSIQQTTPTTLVTSILVEQPISYSDSLNSNYNYPKFQNPQATTIPPLPAPAVAAAAAATPTPVAVSSSAAIMTTKSHQQNQQLPRVMNIAKRKIGEITPLINYQPFQATSTKVELKSYRKTDAINENQQQQQQQQQQSIQSPIQESTESKISTDEIHRNVENINSNNKVTTPNHHHKSGRHHKRISRKSRIKSFPPFENSNNSDSG